MDREITPEDSLVVRVHQDTPHGNSIFTPLEITLNAPNLLCPIYYLALGETPSKETLSFNRGRIAGCLRDSSVNCVYTICVTLCEVNHAHLSFFIYKLMRDIVPHTGRLILFE